MFLGLAQNPCCGRADIVDIDPRDARCAGVVHQYAGPVPVGPRIVEDVDHEHRGPQMGESEAPPLDVALDQLMPGVVPERGVVRCMGAQMYDMGDAGGSGAVDQKLAVMQHVDAVAGEKEQPVDSVQRGAVAVGFIEIEANEFLREALQPIPRVLGPAGGAHGDVVAPRQMAQDGAADLAGRAEDENPGSGGPAHRIVLLQEGMKPEDFARLATLAATSIRYTEAAIGYCDASICSSAARRDLSIGCPIRD